MSISVDGKQLGSLTEIEIFEAVLSLLEELSLDNQMKIYDFLGKALA